MSACYIALGTTRSDSEQIFGQALDRLESLMGSPILALSSTHLTQPVGGVATETFANAAARFDTDIPPAELLECLHQIEADLGRVRTKRWGSRDIDLDLLLHGNQIVNTGQVIVPHPRLWHRRFVLDPLVEIAPDVTHPTRKSTIVELRDRLLARPLPCGLTGGIAPLRDQILDACRSRFPEVCWINAANPAEILATLPAIVFQIPEDGHPTGGDADKVSFSEPVAPLIEGRLLDLSSEPTDRVTTVRDVLNSALGTSRP